MQTAFVSLFYIFINMKPWNASNSSVVVVGLLLHVTEIGAHLNK